MGHKAITTTLRYAHYSDTFLMNAASRLCLSELLLTTESEGGKSEAEWDGLRQAGALF